MTDRAITLHQPWAQLIRDGRKTIETRSWRTRHHGPLSIHAGKAIDREAATWFGYNARTLDTGAHIAVTSLVACIPTETIAWDHLDGEYGLAEGHTWRRVILGPTSLNDRPADDDPRWVTIVDSGQKAMGDFTPGRYAWILTEAQSIHPVRARGRQGIWRVDT